MRAISTGDPFDEFYKQLGTIKDFHRRYPNEPVENLERAYRRRVPVDGEPMPTEVDNMFSGEEAFGRFLDLTQLHEDFLNLPHNNKRVNYIQYLQSFEHFTPPHLVLKRAEKRTDQYFNYVGRLGDYLEGFLRRTKPLDGLDSIFATIEQDFAKAWDANEVSGWELEAKPSGPAAPVTEGTGEGIWCADCAKEFKNDNVYKAHLTGKKHLKAAKDRADAASNGASTANGTNSTPSSATDVNRIKDRAIAGREFRVRRLTSHLDTIRTDTRINVERKQGMTERERQMELEAFYAEQESVPSGGAGGAGARDADDSDSDSEEKIYNPLKLPLAWDGKPIPYWLYKLHGLGVEYSCEICGNFVYMGRRAFDKHFNESRHIYGLKCLGIRNTSMFREITGIGDAIKLWEKMQLDKKTEANKGEGIVQMEDAEGNVMPEKVYWDLQKQGLL